MRHARLQTLTWFLRKSRAKRSYETLVLQTRSVTRGGSLVRNACLETVRVPFWRKFRTKRSFCRLVARSLACALLRICAALVESAFGWRRVTGKRETCWCKPSVSLVSGMIGDIM